MTAETVNIFEMGRSIAGFTYHDWQVDDQKGNFDRDHREYACYDWLGDDLLTVNVEYDDDAILYEWDVFNEIDDTLLAAGISMSLNEAKAAGLNSARSFLLYAAALDDNTGESDVEAFLKALHETA